MPVAVLILIILGGIAVDGAVIFGAQRNLISTAQAAANDAASAVDVDRLRTEGAVEWDLDAIDGAVQAASIQADPDTSIGWTVEGNVVVVTAERDVDLIFTGAVPGVEGRQHISARAEAELRQR